MIYAQFFHTSTGYVPGSIPPRFDDAYKTPIEVCGDRGAVIIDARLSSETIGRIAADECKKRGFTHWQIFKGESFTRSVPISGKWPVQNKIDKTAASATYGA